MKERADKEAEELLEMLSSVRRSRQPEIISLALQAFATGEIVKYINKQLDEQTTNH